MTTTPRETFRIGVPLIDDEHQELQRRMALVARAVAAWRIEAAAVELRALLAAVTTHFADEERWMEAACYPHRGAHERAHQTGLRTLRRSVEVLEQVGPGGHFLEVLERGLSWMEIHLRAEDTQLGRFQEERARVPG